MAYSEFSLEQKKPYLAKARGLLYPDLRKAYQEDERMVHLLAACLYRLRTMVTTEELQNHSKTGLLDDLDL